MKLLPAILCLWTVTHYCSTLPQVKQSHNTLFIKQGDIHTSAHSWSISFYVNITDVLTTTTSLMNSIHDYLKMFKTLQPIQLPDTDNNVRNAYTEVLMHEHTSIRNILTDAQQLSERIEGLSRLCISGCFTTRQRRSLLPVVSSVFEVLFGFATRQKQELIEKHLAVMSQNNQKILHAVEDSITVIDETFLAVQQNREELNNLTDVVSNLATDIDETSLFINNTIIPYQQVMFRAKQMSLTKSVFQQAYTRLVAEVSELQHEISLLIEGHIPVSVLPPQLLRYILRNIKFRMSAGLSLPYDPDNDLAPYYKLFAVHIKPAAVGFLVTATIPIYDDTSTFDVYKSVHVPIFLNLNENYVQATAKYTDQNSYFAISKDSTKIIFLNEAVISFCLSQELHFCFINSATFQVAQLKNNCIIDLFFGYHNVNNSCKTEVSHTSISDPIATFLSVNSWAISSITPIIFTMLCKNGSHKILIEPPMTIMHLLPGCDASSSSISLVNQIPFDSNISIPSFKLNISDLSSIWKPLHVSLTHRNNLNIPSKLESLVRTHTSIPSLVTAINEPVKDNNWMIIIVLLSVIVLFSIYPIYKAITCIKCFKRNIVNNHTPIIYHASEETPQSLSIPLASLPIATSTSKTESSHGLSLSS